LPPLLEKEKARGGIGKGRMRKKQKRAFPPALGDRGKEKATGEKAEKRAHLQASPGGQREEGRKLSSRKGTGKGGFWRAGLSKSKKKAGGGGDWKENKDKAGRGRPPLGRPKQKKRRRQRRRKGKPNRQRDWPLRERVTRGRSEERWDWKRTEGSAGPPPALGGGRRQQKRMGGREAGVQKAAARWGARTGNRSIGTKETVEEAENKGAVPAPPWGKTSSKQKGADWEGARKRRVPPVPLGRRQEAKGRDATGKKKQGSGQLLASRAGMLRRDGNG